MKGLPHATSALLALLNLRRTGYPLSSLPQKLYRESAAPEKDET